MEEQDFGWALKALKRGQAIQRQGWNGKGMFVYHVPAASYPPQTQIAVKAFNGGPVPYGAYLAIKTAQNNINTWVPSVSDVLADDWQIANI